MRTQVVNKGWIPLVVQEVVDMPGYPRHGIQRTYIQFSDGNNICHAEAYGILDARDCVQLLRLVSREIEKVIK